MKKIQMLYTVVMINEKNHYLLTLARVGIQFLSDKDLFLYG